MAKPLVLKVGGKELPFQLNKVERSDLYGYVEIETLDEQGRKCTSAKLAPDGKSVVQSGGTAFAWLDADGAWVERKQLTPVDQNNMPISPVPSSYAAPVDVTESATIDEYLAHNIKAVYALSSEADLGELKQQLESGTILRFPMSFRGGLSADVGFLLMAEDKTLFLAVGQPTKMEFVGFDQPAGVEEEAPEEEEEESLDFGMM